MDNLGTYNLFTSHFVIGCPEVELEYTKTITNEIEALHKWMNYKDTDYGMSKYRTERTNYISFLRIIELKTFKKIVQDLYKSYKSKYEYCEVEDFVNDVFSSTLYYLQEIIEMDLTWIGCPPNETEFQYYYDYEISNREFIDFAIDSKLDISYYKQYFKKVIQYIKSHHFVNNEQEKVESTISESNSINQVKKIKYTANEKALAYLFDLDTNGEQVPKNRVEGCYDAKEIKKIGLNKGFDKPDTFYRGVIKVLSYDRNKKENLQHISADWINAVKDLSTNWEETKRYLISKELFGE